MEPCYLAANKSSADSKSSLPEEWSRDHGVAWASVDQKIYFLHTPQKNLGTVSAEINRTENVN